MNRRTLSTVAAGLMALSLVIAACGPAATPSTPTAPAAPPSLPAPAAPATSIAPAPGRPQAPAKPAAEAPKYGSVLVLYNAGTEPRYDAIGHAVGSANLDLTHQSLWSGDWARGPAGGYGTNETNWDWISMDVFGMKAGYIAEDTKWTADVAKNEGTIIYTIRKGVHWAFDPKSEASRLVNGRQLTADDVVHSLIRSVTIPEAYLWRSNPELREAKITKTGPWEVQVKLPLTSLVGAISRFGNSTAIQAPEIIEKYGYRTLMTWKNSVGTGPFMLTDVVESSSMTLVRNPNYWGKDPVGPGKGNQLPYLDGVKFLVLPDASTRQAALRTAKLDMLAGFSLDDATVMRKTTHALKELQTQGSRLGAMSLRADEPPFDKVKVRQAMLLATDLNAINKGLYGGLGEIQTWPSGRWKGYEPLYLGLNDPEMPATVKELYVYNPEKARQLLKEAGYPSGFKTSAMITAEDVDFFSIIKDMWAKVGVELVLDVKERATAQQIRTNRTHKGVTIMGGADASLFASPSMLMGAGQTNSSMIDDPLINKTIADLNIAFATEGEAKAMAMYKELMKYVLEQVWAIPRPQVPTYVFWWPWVKNYSGETSVGYSDASFPTWVWLDQSLKKSMGY